MNPKDEIGDGLNDCGLGVPYGPHSIGEAAAEAAYAVLRCCHLISAGDWRVPRRIGGTTQQRAQGAVFSNGSPLAPTGAPAAALSDLNPSIPQGESTAAGELRALSKKGTPLHWGVLHAQAQPVIVNDEGTTVARLEPGEHDYDDAKLIAAAVNYVRALPPPPAAGQDLSEVSQDGSTLQKRTYSEAEFLALFTPPPTFPDLEGVKATLRLLADVSEYNVEGGVGLPDTSDMEVVPIPRSWLRRARAALQALEAKDV